MAKLSLIFIIFLAAFFRLYQLSSVPPSPSLDEVSLGWNAYSILQTGKDEFGTSYPLLLRAYDDFRPALYVYLVIPFISLFGLTVTAIRLPSVLLSILTVFSTYGVVSCIQKKNMEITIGPLHLTPALLTSFFLSISPWHIYISRLGHEVNAGLSFLSFGMFFFLAFVEKKKANWYLVVSAIFFALSFGSYQSEKIVVPIIVGLLTINYRKKLFSDSKTVITAGIIGLLFCLPTLYVSLSPQGLTRFSGTTAFSSDSFFYQQEQDKFVKALQSGNTWQRIVYSPKLRNVKIFVHNYSDHFKLDWLFSGGSLDQHKVPYTGLLYPWEGVLLMFGIIGLFKAREFRFLSIAAILLFISFLPAAITTQTPHALRSFTVLPSYQMIEACGAIFLLIFIKKRNAIVLGYIAFLIIPWSVWNMSMNYFVTFPAIQSDSFGYAFADAFIFVKNHEANYDHVVITSIFEGKRYQFQSYMFLLYYLQFNPIEYLSLGGTKSGGLGQRLEFGKYQFTNMKTELLQPKTLYIGNPEALPPSATTIHQSNFLDGTAGVIIGAES